MKKRTHIITLAIILLMLAFVALFLYERSKVALLIDDELAWDLRDASPQMKVLVLKDGTVARYVSEDEDTYTGDIQDTFIVPKEEAVVEIWYACESKGIVFLKSTGKVPVLVEPDLDSDMIGELIYEEGCVPETYRCVGFKDGWFAVEMGAIVGYVNEEYVVWDAIDTF